MQHRKINNDCVLCGQQDGECDPSPRTHHDAVRLKVLAALYDHGALPNSKNWIADAHHIAHTIARLWNTKTIALCHNFMVTGNAMTAFSVAMNEKRLTVTFVVDPTHEEIVDMVLQSMDAETPDLVKAILKSVEELNVSDG